MSIRTRVRVGVEWVNRFHPDACGQASLQYSDNQAEGFYNTMGDHGHQRVFDWGDDDAWETDFRHPDFGGDALNWSDDVHFCMFNDHGGNFNNILIITFAVAQARCSCNSTEWRLGTKMLRWMVFAGCQGVLNTDPAHISAVWSGPMQGVHFIFTYIGDSHDTSWTDEVGIDFARYVCDGENLGWSWVESAYSYWAEDHPIAITVGDGEAGALNRLAHETLDWRDIDVGPSPDTIAWRVRT